MLEGLEEKAPLIAVLRYPASAVVTLNPERDASAKWRPREVHNIRSVAQLKAVIALTLTAPWRAS